MHFVTTISNLQHLTNNFYFDLSKLKNRLESLQQNKAHYSEAVYQQVLQSIQHKLTVLNKNYNDKFYALSSRRALAERVIDFGHYLTAAERAATKRAHAYRDELMMRLQSFTTTFPMQLIMANSRYGNNNAKAGFVTPAAVPAYSGAYSNLCFLNQQALPALSNHYYAALANSLRQHTQVIARNTYLILADGVSIGTGVCVSHNLIIIAKHCLEGYNDAYYEVVPDFYTSQASCAYYPVESCIEHPGYDVALLFVPALPARSKSLTLSFEEQPGGGYLLAHHAGGLPLQLSTGEMVNVGPNNSASSSSSSFASNYAALQHTLIADAGPLASGAGVFDGAKQALIGISTERTIAYGRIARHLLLLATIQPWLLAQLKQYSRFMPYYLEEPIVRTPPAPLLFSENSQTYYSDEREALSWVRAKKHAYAIRAFLTSFGEYQLDSKKKAAVKMPVGENIINNFILDSHQPQHLGTRAKKSPLSGDLGHSVENPLIKAFGIALVNIMALYIRLPHASEVNVLSWDNRDKETVNNWAVDFSPIIVGTARLTQQSSGKLKPTTILQIDGDFPNQFHYYPICADDVKKAQSVNLIHASTLLDVIDCHKPQPTYKLHY